MSEVRINSSELSEMQVLGRGACSTVYKYGENSVIKVLNQSGIQLHNEEQFVRLMQLKNNTCVFPESKVQIDGNFQGYTMEFVKGLELHKVLEDIDINTLIQAIEKAENDFRDLAQDKVLFQDLNQGGIMWDTQKNVFKIIDTDFFEINEEVTEKQCYNANLTSFNTMLEVELGIMKGQGNKLADFLHNNEQFDQKYQEYIIASWIGKDMSITDLLRIAIGEIEKEYGIEPNTLRDMKKIVQEREDIEMDSETDIPIFLPPDEQKTTKETCNWSTVNLVKQVIDEIKDVQLEDETERVMGIYERKNGERKR